MTQNSQKLESPSELEEQATQTIPPPPRALGPQAAPPGLVHHKRLHVLHRRELAPQVKRQHQHRSIGGVPPAEVA